LALKALDSSVNRVGWKVRALEGPWYAKTLGTRRVAARVAAYTAVRLAWRSCPLTV
jgi:hypothetical protein